MTILKGRDFEMAIFLTNCHTDIDISGITDFVCYFYTKEGGAAIERSKDQFTWDETGTIGTTILTGTELNGLDDGVLRYQFDADGQIVKRATNYYLKTPVDFSGQTYTTEEDVESIVDSMTEDFITEAELEEALSGITSGGSVVSVEQVLSAGTKIAEITVNGSGTSIYAPEAQSGTSVSVEQTLSAGTKIAEITVDGSGTSIYAPPAQGGGDYMVVSQLPATAETGQMFFVPAHTEVLSGTVLDASSVIENFCGNFRTTGGTELGAFYHSSDAFHWDYDNSGNVAKKDANGYYYYYRIDAANSLFYFVPIDEMILTPSNGATTAETQTAITLNVPDTTYRYTGSGYEVVPQAKKMYFINNMSQAELADLYAAVSAITSGNTQSINLPELLSNYEFYVAWEIDGQKWCPAYFTNWESGSELWISGIKPSKASYPLSIYRTTACISADGSIRWAYEETPDFNNLANDLTIMVDSAGTINTEHLGDFSNLAKMNRFALHYPGDNNMYAMSPVDYFYRQMENINGEDKLVEYIGGKIEISGITYQGAWHFNEWGWGDRVQPDKWEVYNPVMSQQINNIWTGTRQQYSAQTISNTTLYFLTD